MDEKTLGIAIIGVSSIAHEHARALLRVDGVKLWGVYSTDFNRALEFSDRYNIKPYKNIEELLADKGLDIVDIATIPSQHAYYGILAAKAGKHVIVEKPIDISVDSARALINECRRNNVYLSTIFQHRFGQVIKRAKKLIDQEKLGNVFLVTGKMVCGRDDKYFNVNNGWRGKKSFAGGGVLINQSIHIIDILTYLFGEASSVSGEVDTFNHDIEVEDVAVGIIRFKNNVLGMICATTSAAVNLPYMIEIHGTKGSIFINGDTLTISPVKHNRLVGLFLKHAKRVTQRVPFVSNFKKRFKPGYHKDQFKNIIESIRDNSVPSVSFEDGLNSLEIVEAIFRASESKKNIWVRKTIKKQYHGDYYKKYLEEAIENKPKVLLLNPLNETKGNSTFSHIGRHRLRQPLGLAYTSAFLKKIVHAQLVDSAILRWGADKTVKYINAVSPDILILASNEVDRWQNPDLDMNNIFEIINNSLVDNIIIIGPTGSVTPDWIFSNCKVNFIVRSEPELTCFELVQLLKDGKTDFQGIKGLSYKRGTQIIHNADRIFDNSLNEYPMPDYDSLPMHLYRYSTGDLTWPFTIMLSSRGCPGQCVFCLKKMMPGRYRVNPAERVYEEIKYLVDTFGIRSIYFQDWEFVIDKVRIKQLCKMLIDSPDLKISWGCSARATSLDKELILLMKKAGCVLINFGFESGSKKIVELSQKGVPLGVVKEIVNFCDEQGVIIRAFCLANLPGETRVTLKESAKFIVDNNLNVPRINTPIPYPGTKLAQMIDCDSWEDALRLAGKVNTIMDAEKARKVLRNYIWQNKYGKLYFIKPKFIMYALSIIKNKFF